MKKFIFLLGLIMATHFAFSKDEPVRLENDRLRIVWTRATEGWKITSLQFRIKDKWQTVNHPSGEYTLLYAETKPSDKPEQIFKTITGTSWPDPTYTYQIGVWK